jgi:hypothetical protein
VTHAESGEHTDDAAEVQTVVESPQRAAVIACTPMFGLGRDSGFCRGAHAVCDRQCNERALRANPETQQRRLDLSRPFSGKQSATMDMEAGSYRFAGLIHDTRDGALLSAVADLA